MNKYLSALQVLAKIGRVISEIVYICCIIGGVGCIVGMICMAFLPNMIAKIGGITIWNIVEASEIFKGGVSYVNMILGAIICAGEAVLSKFANIYFKNEIKEGTPFTMKGAGEMMRLGILGICIPVGTSIINGIVYALMKIADADTSRIEFSTVSSVGLGIAFIIISVIIKCSVSMNDGPAMKDYVVEDWKHDN